MKIQRFFGLFALPLVFGLASVEASAQTVYIIGDSTVSNFSPPDPRQGWGQVIGRNFAEDVEIKNYALSGRSSKSFWEEGAWKPVVAQLKSGDYVLIQFGHNDEKNDERGTDAYGDYLDYLSRYVDDSLKAGAQPVLITPVSRGSFKSGSSHGTYPDAMIYLAKKKHVPYIDLTTMSEDYYGKIGESAEYKLFIASIDGKDNTHFTPAGAIAIANLVAQGIKALDLPLSARVVRTQ